MNQCDCRARWRYNHPHGRRSKGYTVFVRKHHSKCKHGRADKFTEKEEADMYKELMRKVNRSEKKLG